MRYSVFKYGSLVLTDVEDLGQAKQETLNFVTSMQSEYIEVRDSDNETVIIGYFVGRRFHWTKDKGQPEAWEGLAFVTKPPLWCDCSRPERMSFGKELV